MSEALFFRLLTQDDKGAVLADAVAALREGGEPSHVFSAEPESFEQVPGAPFAYWVSDRFRQIFRDMPAFENDERTVRAGLQTSDDFRFLRNWWEVSGGAICPPNQYPDDTAKIPSVSRKYRWFPHAKGGVYSPFYSDLNLVINWARDGEELKEWTGQLYGGTHWSKSLRNLDFYFRPGLTYPRRLHRMAVAPLPKGSIISVRGSGIFTPTDQLLSTAGLFSSSAFDFLVKMMLGRFGHPQFDGGTLNAVRVPENLYVHTDVGIPTLACIKLKRNLDTANETSHVFQLPALLQVTGESLAQRIAAWQAWVVEAERQLESHQREIDDMAFKLYGIEGEDRRAIEESLTGGSADSQAGDVSADEDEGESEAPTGDPRPLVVDLLSYAIGCAFGRWDVRFATGERSFPQLPDPFAPLPVYAPGALTPDSWLVAYPLAIDLDGILVDDEGHAEDIERRVREAIQVIWGECADAFEQEACAILGVRSLREYFRNTNKFFADHLKRYSKSRRVAPIYWPLSTPSGSYTLWLYYHRLTDQTLYTCVNDFVDPKLKQVAEEASRLRQKSGRTTADERDLERLSNLELELKDFRAELLQIAAFWKPNLNDGVQITAAPLRKLFRHSQWQKRLKEAWEKLEAGAYDWAHLAYSIWPERVREKCRTDKSLAIAHDLEQLYEEPPAKASKQRGGKVKQRSEDLEEQEGLFYEA